MHIKKKFFIPLLLVLVVLVVLGLFELSKSRTFQFFGVLINRVNTDEKVVALTFDDGPTEYTKEVLGILDEKDIKATFFLIGNQLEKHQDIGKEIVEAGHEIGNHSYSHPRFLLVSQSFIAEEIEKTDVLIRATGHEGDIHFRPPHGRKLFGLPWYLSQHNIKTIMWDVEPDTYIDEAGDSAQNTEFIVQYTLENTRPGSIIILHPFCESCSAQREAISRFVDDLQAMGYKFVTVSELLAYEKEG